MSVRPMVKAWTLEELHRLPDDGNKYELVRGELFVTPAPAPKHQQVIARLLMLLVPYVAQQGVGQVHTARAVVRRGGSEVEPDLYVGWIGETWEDSPAPILVVEVLSDSTRRRDQGPKRLFYMEDARVPEYWVVDGEAGAIRVVRARHEDLLVTDTMTWQPEGASAPLTFRVTDLLGPAF